MKINFDVWFSETKSLHSSGKVSKALSLLEDKKLAYQSDGAWWLKTSAYGDDEDRVLVKSDGSYSYFLVDIAYHLDKLERGFVKLINFWGADHHGHVKRMLAALTALGYPEALKIIVMQLVTLVKDGQEVRMSKRAGNFVIINDLINEVGLDVARFFFLLQGSDSHINFDLGLAKDKSDKNPVYYVQYAHARMASILNKIETDKIKVSAAKHDYSEAARQLALALSDFPDLLRIIGRTYELQKLPNYLIDLARSFHHFYDNDRIISAEQADSLNLDLLLATKKVLASGLGLLGVSAPDKM